MKRTSWLDLLLPFLVFGVAGYAFFHVYYDRLPALGYLVPVPLAALGAVELVVARRVRMAVRHVPLAKPMTAIAIARCVALGKASSVVGAAVAGVAVALLVRVVPDSGTVTAASHDTRVGIFLLAASILVCAAGLVLERSGIDPNRDRRDSRDQQDQDQEGPFRSGR